MRAGDVGEATQLETQTVVTAPAAPLILTLQNRPEVTWTDDTIDNEHLGRRSSKRCCIFHKIKRFGESDSDETSSDEEGSDKESAVDDDEGAKNGAPKKVGGKKKIKNYQRHHA